MNKDLLEASISILKSKMDTIMFDVNSMLSSMQYEDNMAKKLASKISKLSKANYDYQQAINLKIQMMKLEVESLINSPKDNSDDNSGFKPE